MTDQNEDQTTTPEKEETPTIPETRPEYPKIEGDFLHLGPEIFTRVDDQSVISWKGVNYVPQETKQEAPKALKEYGSGEKVEVFRDGDWTEGMVNGVEKRLNLVYVHTSRGPVTVARVDSIRPLVR